jgi:hypothetical protein
MSSAYLAVLAEWFRAGDPEIENSENRRVFTGPPVDDGPGWT